MQRFFAFGCSFTKYKWPTWADILSRSSDYYENWGQVGAGNSFIFNSVIECHLRNTFTKDDTVCIMWTNVSREDRYVDHKWVLPGNIYTQFTYDEDFVKKFADIRGYYIRDLALIYAIQQLLKQIGCRYVMLSMIPMTNPSQYDNTDVSENIKDILSYYQTTLEEVRPSVYETVFDHDWWSRPFLPGSLDELEKHYRANAGSDWPSWERFLKKDFQGIKTHIVEELLDKKKWDWDSMIRWKKRADAHPTPMEHLEYIEKIMPEFPVSQDTKDWAKKINELLWKEKDFGHLWQAPKITRW